MSSDDKLEGVAKEFYDNGSLLRETPFQGGKRQGVSKEFLKNGQVKREVLFENDLPQGAARAYYDSGNLRIEEFFEKGERVRLKRFKPSGELVSDQTF